MAFFLLPNNSITSAQAVTRKSIKEAGYTENEVRDLVAANIGKFFPGLKTIATEFSRWQDSSRRLDILAIDTERNLYVMEFKRDNDAAHAELQALRYAAMLSVCDFNDLVEAGHQYRLKANAAAQINDWRNELATYLGEADPEAIELPRIPRVILISSQFNKEITTTVLWLNEMFGAVSEDVQGMDITCLEVGVYDLGGQRALHFDQIIPVPQAEEYQVRARAKELDSVKKQARSKRTRSVALLESHGLLQPGTKIALIDTRLKALGVTDLAEREAVFAGGGRFSWRANGQTYESLNALTRALHETHGAQMGTIQATQYWRLGSGSLSLAEEAEKLAPVTE